ARSCVSTNHLLQFFNLQPFNLQPFNPSNLSFLPGISNLCTCNSINYRMKEISVEELKELKDSGDDFQLIDVREPYEYDVSNLGGELIPLGNVPNNVEKIARDKKVVLYCRSGRRSADAITWLERNHKFDNLYNLQGGILEWVAEIDPDMDTY